MEIIKISAVWCSGCLIMNKVFKKIEKEYNIPITNFDIDFDSEEVKKYNIGSQLPVIIIKKNSKEVKRIIGEKSFEEVKKIIDEEII